MLNIDCILDRFSFDCFGKEATLRPLALDDRCQEKPDLLLVESAWNSIDGGWYLGNRSNEEQFRAVIDSYQQKGVPTVYWGKEDPVQTHRFQWMTPLFDYVFTTDKESVEVHREHVKHNRVYPLPFAAQVKMQYADMNVKRQMRPCFAGVYYPDILPDRRREADTVLLPAIPYGLHLYDRGLADNFYLHQRTFPEKFDPAVKPGIPYSEMGNLYRSYAVFMNINCVNASPTMFSRRVFEVLASGTPLISSYALGIEQLFGNVVHLSRSAADTTGYLEELLQDKQYWSTCSLRGQRAILREHTYTHRLHQILEACGVPVPPAMSRTLYLYQQAAEATTQAEISALLQIAHSEQSQTTDSALRTDNVPQTLLPTL